MTNNTAYKTLRNNIQVLLLQFNKNPKIKDENQKIIKYTPMYQILMESDNLRWSYCNLDISSLAVVCHLGFDKQWIFSVLWYQGNHIAPVYQIRLDVGCQKSTAGKT